MEKLRIPSEISPLLLLIGALLIAVGLFLLLLGFAPAEKIESGGLIIVGPFPIAFHGEVSSILVLLILLLPITVFIALVLYFMRLASRLERGEEDP